MKKYFLFSAKYKQDRNDIEAKRGKEFVLGTVVVNGTKKEYTMISDSATAFNNYRDVRIVAYLDTATTKYTEPTSRKKSSL